MGGTTGVAIPFYPIALYDKDGVPVTSMVAAYAVHHDTSVNIADAYSQEGFDFSGTKNFDKKTGYRSRSFLTVPMKNHENEIIGVLQLINAKDRATGAVGTFSDADQHLAESLASQAAIALTNRLLINHLENLFESFIGLINAAIDDKSPYTSGHCERVPILTMMLADAVDNCKVGPLKSFTMTERDRYELQDRRPAARLRQGHHAGARGRQGDQAADALRSHPSRRYAFRGHPARRPARAAGGQAARRCRTATGEALADAERDGEARLAGIDADRAFLRQCNVGAERMRAEDQQRVRQISARYRWRDGDGARGGFPDRGRSREPDDTRRHADRARSGTSSITTSTSRSRCSRRCRGRGT